MSNHNIIVGSESVYVRNLTIPTNTDFSFTFNLIDFSNNPLMFHTDQKHNQYSTGLLVLV